MSYTFSVRVRQTTAASEWAEVVESTVWHFANGGTWRETSGELVLTMGGSGTSGLLRFARGKDEFCVFAMGVHNYKPWTDCVVDCKPSETACNTQPAASPFPPISGGTKGIENAKIAENALKMLPNAFSMPFVPPKTFGKGLAAGCDMHPDYYGGGERAKCREKQQRETCKKDCKGREYKIVCSGEGNNCVVEIFIE